MKRYVGKKMKVNKKNNAELKIIFEKLGIRRCEDCGSTFGLTYAHSQKRKDVKSDADYKEVAILCLKCHIRYEQFQPPIMTRKIRNLIAKRQPVFKTA